MIGIFLTGYVTWFTLKFEKPYIPEGTSEENKYLYDRMYNWITFQYFYAYFSIIFMFMITWMYRKMDAQAKDLAPATRKKGGETEMQNYTLQDKNE